MKTMIPAILLTALGAAAQNASAQTSQSPRTAPSAPEAPVPALRMPEVSIQSDAPNPVPPVPAQAPQAPQAAAVDPRVARQAQAVVAPAPFAHSAAPTAAFISPNTSANSSASSSADASVDTQDRVGQDTLRALGNDPSGAQGRGSLALPPQERGSGEAAVLAKSAPASAAASPEANHTASDTLARLTSPASDSAQTSAAVASGTTESPAGNTGAPQSTQFISGGDDASAKAANERLATLTAGGAGEGGSLQFWQSISMVTFLLAAVGAGGFMVVRMRTRGSFGLQKAEKQMAIVSSLSLSPKRQIILVKIRDQEIAVASTEHGISFLSEIGASQGAAQRIQVDREIPDALPEATLPRRARVARTIEKPHAVTDAMAALNGANEKSPDAFEQEAIRSKSDILLGALKNLKEKKTQGGNRAVEPTASPADSERAQSAPRAHTRAGNASAQGESKAAFPKYLANAFEQESKRPLERADQDRSGDAESVESVTNMIREKLKEMRPI